jgi:hypothetical protein
MATGGVIRVARLAIMPAPDQPELISPRLAAERLPRVIPRISQDAFPVHDPVRPEPILGAILHRRIDIEE